MPIRKKYRVTSSKSQKKEVVKKRRLSFGSSKIRRKKGIIKKSFRPSFFRKLFRRKKNKNHGLKKFLQIFFKLAIIMSVVGAIGIAGILIYFSKDIPNPDKIVDRSVAQSTKIYDHTGKHLLYEIHGKENRTIIKLNQISKYLIDATIATEDQDFYDHHGIDFRGIARATYKDIISGKKIQGGSTITQQLVKNSILTSKRTFTRKIKEIILAIETEQKFSKDKILEMYFNQIPYGSNAYGVEAASQTFFGKPAKDLDISEAALLASLPKATTYYSPYGTHSKALETRYKYIIGQMLKMGYINKKEATQAKNVDILKKVKPFKEYIKAPHFVMYVKQQLVDEFGEDKVEKGGLKVYTTLNYDMQLIAEDAIKKGALKNSKNYNAHNAALVALDPKSGQILAMVGSKDYFDIKEDGNVNVATSLRQPGSSFKPFVYATAFDKGYTPDTILFNVRTDFGKDGSGKDYIPNNYNLRFSGPVTMRQALAQSLNIPAVKTLYLAGIKDSIKMAQNLGISTLNNNPDSYGLSLVLGTGEVKLLDMVSAYSVFANNGKRNPYISILKIEDSNGNVLEKFKKNEKQVLDIKIAKNINSILSDNVARTPTFGPKSKLYFGKRPVAVKTGTTNDYKDGWTIGYTPSLVAGVWAGNTKGEKMRRGSGLAVAAPIWHDFMSRVLISTPIEKFLAPEKIETGKAVLDGDYKNKIIIKIDKACGDKLAGELTPENQIEKKTYLEIHNILYYVKKDNPRGASPKNPSTDPNFSNWEKGVLEWVKKNGQVVNISPPTEICSVRENSKMPILKVLSPQDNQIIKNGKLAIKVKAFTIFGLKQFDFYFDNILIGIGENSPYEASYKLPANIADGMHTVTIKVYDKVENSAQKEISVIVTKDNASLYLKPLMDSDFPFVINVVTARTDVKKVSFYYQLDSVYDADMNLISKPGLRQKIGVANFPVHSENNLYQFLWEEDKQYFISGRYKIFAVMEDQTGKTYKSNERFVDIK